jgi:DNA-directed RNA polymerase subunit M/transcription elongation factor TFIIS
METILKQKFGKKYNQINKLLLTYKENNSENEYKDFLYHIMNEENHENIFNSKIGLEHTFFDTYRNLEQEENEFITNPMVVDEGVFECPKCSSKRTISWGKQIRSGDEGTSVFAKCIECNHNWRIS